MSFPFRTTFGESHEFLYVYVFHFHLSQDGFIFLLISSFINCYFRSVFFNFHPLVPFQLSAHCWSLGICLAPQPGRAPGWEQGCGARTRVQVAVLPLSGPQLSSLTDSSVFPWGKTQPGFLPCTPQCWGNEIHFGCSFSTGGLEGPGGHLSMACDSPRDQ